MSVCPPRAIAGQPSVWAGVGPSKAPSNQARVSALKTSRALIPATLPLRALVPETPEQLYERAKDALRMPPLDEWESFPFDGDMRLRALQPPVDREPARHGEGAVDCGRCTTADDAYVWTDDRWRLWALAPRDCRQSCCSSPACTTPIRVTFPTTSRRSSASC